MEISSYARTIHVSAVLMIDSTGILKGNDQTSCGISSYLSQQTNRVSNIQA